jgi:hypothetical protein
MSDASTLRARVPGQSVMSTVLAAQHVLPERSQVARLLGGSPLGRDNRQLFRAALGEVLVGESLDTLGPEWDVLHAVPGADGDYEIDHLAIGPSGVFTITTKNTGGDEIVVDGERLLVAGVATDYLREARLEAQSAAELLSGAANRSVVVQPVIVVVDPKKLTIRADAAGVLIVTSKQLLRLLGRLERSLPGTEVAFISDVADRASTWRTAAQSGPATQLSGPDAELLGHEFRLLRQSVADATRRRMLWGIAAFAAACLLMWASIATIASLVMMGR